MQFTAEDEPDLTFPNDSVVRARLQEIKLRTFSWNDKSTGEKKESENLEWWWEVTATDLGPEYVGRRVKGSCKPKLSNREGNRFREWSEALLDRTIPIGMSIDTDDLIGLEAEIVIEQEPDRKDPAKVWEVVTNVSPIGDGGYVEPPF